ncbi:MAG: AsmA-like C-terminal domain-containing protein, partial [Candidatus Hydrogenedentes bacterium]|nr:AsmA-like C-terminal domain-containing protein [Candidatus Hydrogenedentota bacterium]
MSKDLLSDWGGTLTVDRFKATLGAKGLPADLELAAGIEDGRVALAAPGYVDTFSNVTAHATADPKAIKFDLEMRSAQAGTFSLNGGYIAKTGAVNGALTADAAQCALPFLSSIEARQTWFPVIQGLGLSTFRIEVHWPPSEKDEVPVHITRDGEPPCSATFTLAKREGKWTLGEMDASVAVPLKLVQPVIPKAVEAEGDIVLRARRSADSPALAIEADLTGVDAVVGDYLNKKRGDRLAVETVFETKTGGVDLNAVHVRYGDLDVPVRIQDGGAYVDNIDLDLVSLAGLLPKQGAAHGRVRGSFGTKPLAATLDLDGVGAFVAPDMGIDKISGRVTVHGARVVLQDVHAQGLDSDCTFNAELIDGVFHGRANGSRLNLNDVIHFVDHLKDYKKNPKPENENEPWHPSPIACELQVTLDTLIYRKGAAQEVSGDFSLHEEVVRATKLVATPYTGRLTGSLEVDPSHKKIPGRVVLDFETQSADLRFVDETVFDKPRELAGTVTGKVSMSILTGTDVDAIEGTNGGFALDAQNGSLGEIAFATQLRNLLKTTTLVRLRLPEYGKDALGFDRFHATVAMKNGVWTIQEAEMQNPYLAMSGEGAIDFPHRATDVRLRINFLESVTGLLARLPLLGEAISKVGGMTGLDLQVYDSPY